MLRVPEEGEGVVPNTVDTEYVYFAFSAASNCISHVVELFVLGKPPLGVIVTDHDVPEVRPVSAKFT